MTAVPAAALRLWRRLADDADALAPGTRRVARDTNGFCPPGWVGVVRLGDAYVVDPGVVHDAVIERLLALEDPTDPDQVRTVMAMDQALGPAELSYLPDRWRAPDGAAESAADSVLLDEREVADLRGWLASLPADDLADSSVVDMPRAVVATVADQVAGAVGHLAWPEQVAHVGIIVDPAFRRRGIGRRLAVAGTLRAREAGLAPQWRAASGNRGSRALAAATGYVEVGRQFSFAPAT